MDRWLCNSDHKQVIQSKLGSRKSGKQWTKHCKRTMESVHHEEGTGIIHPKETCTEKIALITQQASVSRRLPLSLASRNHSLTRQRFWTQTRQKLTCSSPEYGTDMNIPTSQRYENIAKINSLLRKLSISYQYHTD